MCGAARLRDDAVRYVPKLPKIRPARDFDGSSIHCRLDASARVHLVIARTAMADDIAKYHPGQGDVSDQFSAGANLTKALADYKAIKDSGGDYEFGELTAKYYNLDATEHGHWKDSIDTYYPSD